LTADNSVFPYSNAKDMRVTQDLKSFGEIIAHAQCSLYLVYLVPRSVIWAKLAPWILLVRILSPDFSSGCLIGF
jgi:hypothetical protein